MCVCVCVFVVTAKARDSIVLAGMSFFFRSWAAAPSDASSPSKNAARWTAVRTPTAVSGLRTQVLDCRKTSSAVLAEDVLEQLARSFLALYGDALQVGVVGDTLGAEVCGALALYAARGVASLMRQLRANAGTGALS